MREELTNHPAVAFGRWLRERRMEKGITASVFAGRIGLSPAKYAEVEVGVVSWIGDKQETYIPLLLATDGNFASDFSNKLFKAREVQPLRFQDIFTRDQLAPARCCTVSGKQITEAQKNEILNAVFTPLD